MRSPAERAALRLLALVAGTVIALWLMHALRHVLTPLAVAFALAYFLNPAVNAMEGFFERDAAKSRLRRHLHARAVAVGLLVVAVVAVLVVAIVFVAPAIYEQVLDAVHRLPQFASNVRAKVEPLIERLNLRYPEQVEQVRARAEETLKSHLPQILSPITHALQRAFSSLLSFVLTILHFVVIPVFTVFLLADMNRIRQGAGELVPPRLRPYVTTRISEIDQKLAAFVRGQVTVCLILGTFYAIALTVVGLPMSLLVGYVVAFFNMVPFMATVLGLPLVLILSFVDQGSLSAAATVAGIFVFGHLVESHFITPRLVGGKLGLHPVVIMMAVLVGGTLLGFIGMLIAVPTTAALSVFWPDLVDLYKRSAFYRAAEPPAA
jgi:predicted PurR-regulated permease PerM